MKFTIGYWLNLPGVKNADCVQIREVKITEKQVYLYTVPYIDDERRAGGPVLEFFLSAPRADILRTQVYHYMGSAKKEPQFELDAEARTLEVEEFEGGLSIKSGKTELRITKNPASFVYYYEGKYLTRIGDRFGHAMISTLKTPEGPFMRVQMDVGIGEKVYGLGERFTPFVKNGQVVDIWNEDGGTCTEISYKNIPFYMTNRGYGVLVNSSGRVSYEVCSEMVTRVQFSLPGEKIDFMVVGGGDAQLGCVGVGVVDPNQAAVFGGSFWQYEFNTANGKTDPGCRVRVNCHAVPGVWQYEALAFKPGLVMRWFRDGFCQLEKQQAEATGKDPYYLMDKEAAKVPAGCHGMMCAFSDVMNFISWKHAAPTFTNFELDPERFSRYTFYRAILENTAMLTRGHLELVKEATGNMPQEIVFAGGAAKSPLWCQIVADVLGLPVKVPVVKEATALGAAILAGYGVGIYKDISATARELVQWDKTYAPNMENHAVYEEMYGPWRRVYAAQLTLCDEKLTKNMWIAPGL